MGIIYKITNRQNGKVYIGQTVQELEVRWYHHVYDATVKKLKTKLGRAIRKYGKECFDIEELEKTESLDEREIYFIHLFGSIKKGYNIKIGGNGGPHAESTKKKISKANTKRVWTEEMRQTMSESIKEWHKERGFVPRSEETRRKISEGNKGRKIAPKAKEAMEAFNKSRMKPVVCITNGKEYESIMAACKDLSLNDGYLTQHLKGKHKSIKGFVFKYKEK